MITIKIADLPIGIDNKYDHIKESSIDFLTDEAPVFTVHASDTDIERDKALIEEPNAPLAYVEKISVYRHICERLNEFDAFLMHGSAIELNGKAYIFTAHSGVGKTTHTRLWLSEFGDEVSVLNGDKPIIRFFDGVPYACGTPWQGKECYGKNAMLPIGGVAFLSRALKNTACKMKPSDAVSRVVSQIYLPKSSPIALAKTLRLIDSMLRTVTLVDLHCNMEKDAPAVCRAALVNSDFTGGEEE